MPSQTRIATILCFSVWILCGSTSSSKAEDWLRFRGPNGSGISPDATAPPIEWNLSQDLKWKTPLPGPGLSSPIVVGQRVFATCWSGYGVQQEESEEAGDQTQLKRHLVCLDCGSGEILWNREIDPFLPEDPFGGNFAENGYASHSPVSDGSSVFVFLGKTGAMAFTLAGDLKWANNLGTGSNPQGWGSAASPILYRDLLIVTASAESESLVGLDKHTGEEVWRQEATGLSGIWATPILVKVNDDRMDLVVVVPGEIWGFDPATGEFRWYCESPYSRNVTSSAVAAGNTIYAIGGRDGGSIAVRAGGEGDVTDTHIVWTGRHRAGIGTPLVHKGRLHWISSGIAHTIDATTGETVGQVRIPRTTSNRDANEADASPENGRRGGGRRGRDYGSPVIADDTLYFVSRNGTVTVMEVGDELKPVATNKIGGEGEEFSATPAIVDGQIYLRSSRYLYRIGS